MKLADGIRKHGFRKWYERELLQSHAHLALTFMCTVGIFAAFEAASKFQTWTDRLTDVVAILLCGATGLWALRRYLFLLTHAEAVAHQADCPACDTYARFKIVHAHAEGSVVSVQCKQCAHQWTIES
jgi:hypothetical protein